PGRILRWVMSRGLTTSPLGWARAFDVYLPGLAPRQLRQLSRHNAPAIRPKLAAEPAADMVHMNLDVSRRHPQRSAHLAGDPRHILCRRVDEQVLLVCPFGDLAVGFQAAMSYHRYTVVALDYRGGFPERLIRVAVALLSGRLGPTAGADRVRVNDKVRHLLVFNLYRQRRFGGRRLVHRGQRHYLIACPMNLAPGTLYYLDRFDPG